METGLFEVLWLLSSFSCKLSPFPDSEFHIYGVGKRSCAEVDREIMARCENDAFTARVGVRCNGVATHPK